ncbi:SHOCT domain-containing protein [Undibacterium sp. CY18W]|uniref:SHOCT domain-containing protein n=1 Tax=Undibacterium hunanense TaxID=2762292 RepID=A0ABR6ZN35_9BURK|nr:SHOCT domain-containing protein [Undibacterium hunanense]MBC3917305.1 SHOCT domain-containing protein [Undibacterium hunanense]
MRKIVPLISALTVLLSACIGAPKVDFANIDSTCAQQCSANHTTCISGFKLFPLANEASCKTAMETCAQACPTKTEVANSARTKSAPVSTAEKLKEIDTLLKDGLITKTEYEAKRQDILKSM